MIRHSRVLADCTPATRGFPELVGGVVEVVVVVGAVVILVVVVAGVVIVVSVVLVATCGAPANCSTSPHSQGTTARRSPLESVGSRSSTCCCGTSAAEAVVIELVLELSLEIVLE